MGNTCCGEAQKPDTDVYEQQLSDYESKKQAMLKNGAHQLICNVCGNEYVSNRGRQPCPPCRAQEASKGNQWESYGEWASTPPEG